VPTVGEVPVGADRHAGPQQRTGHVRPAQVPQVHAFRQPAGVEALGGGQEHRGADAPPRRHLVADAAPHQSGTDGKRSAPKPPGEEVGTGAGKAPQERDGRLPESADLLEDAVRAVLAPARREEPRRVRYEVHRGPT
jgi:hypothetical protein